MSLPKFVIGMIIVIAAVCIWSYIDSATIGTIVLRMIVSAIILQVGYFLVVLFLVTANPSKQPKKSSPPQGELRPAKREELTTKRT